jgi:hypothetical protein
MSEDFEYLPFMDQPLHRCMVRLVDTAIASAIAIGASHPQESAALIDAANALIGRMYRNLPEEAKRENEENE